MPELPFEDWTPRHIVAALDEYVVGQDQAKRSMAVALRNRHRRLCVASPMREEILPNNILMIGPTGVGKTEIARRIARLSGAPFLKVEATKFTEVGYVGRDVESIVRDLTEIAVAMVRREMSERVLGRAEKHVEERLLNLLQPRRRKETDPGGAGRNGGANGAANGFANGGANGRGNERNPGEGGRGNWQMLRSKLRDDLRAGLLERRTVEIDILETRGSGVELLTQLGLDPPNAPSSETLEGIFPRRKKRRRVTVAEARRFFVQEETRRMIDADAAIELALARVQSSGIVFVDEIDKICSTGHGHHGPEVSRQGVQRDLLPIIEGCAVPTKYGVVRTDHILFIAAGAFHHCRPADLLPELQGRLPIRVELRDLTARDFLRILTEPRNSLVRQYEALLRTEGVELRFTGDALEEVAGIAYRVNQSTENIGARRLQTVLNTVLEEILFELPEAAAPAIPEAMAALPSGDRRSNGGCRSGERALRTIVIERDYVERRLARIVGDRDLSSYIL